MKTKLIVDLWICTQKGAQTMHVCVANLGTTTVFMCKKSDDKTTRNLYRLRSPVVCTFVKDIAWRLFVCCAQEVFFFFFFVFFLFFPFLLPCTWDWWGEKHTETTTSPFLSQLLIHDYKMFMQTIEIHCPKATGAHPKGKQHFVYIQTTTVYQSSVSV